MKRYRITLDGRTFDVRLLSDPRQEQIQVEVNGKPLTVEVQNVPVAERLAGAMPPPAAVALPTTEAAARRANTIAAPLPGIIKSVAVRTDQQVAIGDALVIIEAMKMDNIIRAPRAGTIGAVYVSEGRQVAHGEPMLAYHE
jgi:biotin carboxyl carrier protein